MANSVNTKIPNDVLKLAESMYGDAEGYSVYRALYRTLYYICNFCNITEIPESLYFTWVDMAGYYVRYVQEPERPNVTLPSFPDVEGSENVITNQLSQTQMLNKISTITMGDTSISFHEEKLEEDINTNPRYEYNKYKTEEDFLKSFHHILYNFRRMKY